MTKTITLRVDNAVYNIISQAANWENRTISNYIEVATRSHIANKMFVSDDEMAEIMENTDSLDKWLKDVNKWNYETVC